MTPELKQDLDDLFNSTIAAAQELHDHHGVTMGQLEITLDEPLVPCADCDCGLTDGALPVVETLDDFDAIVRHITAAFTEAVHEAKDDMQADLELLAKAAGESDLDEDLLGVILTSHMLTMATELEAAFEG